VDVILEALDRPEEIAEGPASSLPQAIQTAHRRVWQATLGDETLAGMGTTVVALAMSADQAVVAHVGDSRAYRYRQGSLEQLTQDHSWVGEQVTAGLLSPDQARLHPLKNVITRALGGQNGLEVEVGQWDLRNRDLFLLCSDGLTGMLEDSEIADCLSVAESLDGAAEDLVRHANERGGLDNITVVLVQTAD
jgi:protein phosphatase